MEARALDGAHQPEVAAVLGFSASLAVQLSPYWVRRSSFKWSPEASDLSSEALGA